MSLENSPRRSLLAALVLGLLAGEAAAEESPDPFRGLNGRPGQSVTLLQGGPAAGEPKKPDPSDPGSLAELSIEQLLEQEIVPINVLGGHTHPKGQWMVGYRYMFMTGDGNRDGTRRVGHGAILRHFVTAPLDMDMEMHMLEAMYAPSDRLTLMAMLPYRTMRMNKLSLIPGGGHGGGHGHGHGAVSPSHDGEGHGKPRFPVKENSSGFGDVGLMGLYTFWGSYEKGQRLLFNAGVTLPSGSIYKGAAGHRHEYMMQLGSGTVDLQPGITYLREQHKLSLGAQALGTIRLGRNDVGYALGNQVLFNTWAAYSINDWLAPSLRLEGRWWGNVRGRDPLLDPLLEPGQDPRRQGGRRLDVLVGLNLYAPKGKLKGTRLSIEGGLPVYQSLDGPQIENDWQLSLSLSYTR